MKSISKYFHFLFILVAAVSCSGNIDDDKDGGDAALLTISADKTVIAADGKHFIRFTVNFGDEWVSLSENTCLVVSSPDKSMTTRLAPGQDTFSSIVPGEYLVSAVYTDSDRNSFVSDDLAVELTDEGIELPHFRRRMLFPYFTSVGCPNCPAMVESLGKVQSDRPGMVVPVALHVPYSVPDPMVIPMGKTIMQRFGVSGIPAAFMNYSPDKEVTASVESINTALDAALAEDISPCGLSVNSSFDSSDNRLKLDIGITPVEYGQYRYIVFLVEDAFEYGGGVYDRVVRSVMSSNVWGDKLNGGLKPLPQIEITAKKRVTIPDGCNPENLKTVVAVLYAENEDYYCINAVECGLNQTIEYVYNRE